jgi:hypothetical protein
MAQKPTNTVQVEVWNVRKGTSQASTVTKVAVRVQKGAQGGNRPGTFHGATNFRGSVLGK